MALTGLIFDLDGTLIDSNDAHVEAWLRSLRQHGYNVEPDRIFTEIGKGGDKLVQEILGGKAEETRGDELRATATKEFASIALDRGLAPMRGAVELIAELRRRRLTIALATSSSKEQLGVAERASGVKWRSLMDVVVTASDVAETKPAPDLVQVAAEKLDLTPAQCAMLGDTPWDAQAASGAGVVLLGVTCGGNAEDVLLRQGARAVYRDPGDLLGQVEEALVQASPQTVTPDGALLARLMKAALAEGEAGLVAGELPVGCVIADGSGEIISAGHDGCNHSRNRLAHAEMTALGRVADRLQPDARDTILVCTVEPCVMCVGAAAEAGVDTIIFGLSVPVHGGATRVIPTSSPLVRPPRIVGQVRVDQSRRLFERWLKSAEHNPRQEGHVRALLAPPPRPGKR